MDTAFRETFERVSKHVEAGMASGLYGFGLEFESAQRSRAVLRGRDVVMLTSNNYLGLADHPAVLDARIEAVWQYGSGTCGARLHNGSTPLHRGLERRVAAWLGYEDAVIFSSGYLTNVGTVSALTDSKTTVVIDRLNHMSTHNACRVGDGALRIFPHNDLEKLEHILARATTEKRLVVVEGVYSMDGDIAPLADIAKLTESYGAMLMVDEAHGIGVLGEGGKGTGAHYGVRPDITMGTFSKSFAGTGGFVATSTAAAHFIRHTAHAYIFATSLAPAELAGANAALDVMLAEPWRVEKLWANTMRLRSGLISAGFDVLDSVTPIVPIHIGDSMTAMAMTAEMLREDVYIGAAIFPTVPQGKSRLRATVTAALETQDIDYALDVMIRVGKKHGIIE